MTRTNINYINQCTHWFHRTRERACAHRIHYAAHSSPKSLQRWCNLIMGNMSGSVRVHGVACEAAHWIMGKSEKWGSVKTPFEDLSRIICLCRFWYFTLSVCISKSFFYVSIHSPLTLTKSSWSRFPFGPNGNASLLFHSRDHRKTRNGGAAIDKSIMQSEWTNCGFHHLAHQQLFLMNYLLTPFFLFLPALSSWCGKIPSRISKQGLSLPVSQSKSGASSSSPRLQAELFTTHWCGGWPAVLLVNYSCSSLLLVQRINTENLFSFLFVVLQNLHSTK